MKAKRLLRLVLVPLLLSGLVALADGPTSGTLSLGEDKTYERGTARAKEEILEFPYRHSKGGSKVFWASVVHEGKKSRLIVKASEAQGKRDKSGQLAIQEFEPDDPFQKTLDEIRHDAFVNLHKDLLKQKPLSKDGWKLMGEGSAVYKLFYKNSRGRIYCFLALEEPGSESLRGPLVVYFERSRQGPMMSSQQGGGTSWSPPQRVDPIKNAAAYKVFTYLEKRSGF